MAEAPVRRQPLTLETKGGDVKADNISLKQHKHTEQGDGKQTSAAQS